MFCLGYTIGCGVFCQPSKKLVVVFNKMDVGVMSMACFVRIRHAVYGDIFSRDKSRIFLEKMIFFSNFCSKHGLCVHVRTASPSTHNL